MDTFYGFDQINKTKQQPTTSRSRESQALHRSDKTQDQLPDRIDYQMKCRLLDYHIQEAILVNKALRSELKQYKDKIDFEKKLQKYLANRLRESDH